MRHRRTGRDVVASALAFAAGMAVLASTAGPASGQDAEQGYALQFVEHYVGPKQKAPPAGSLGPYRVAFTQTVEIVTDKPGGAPVRTSVTRRAVYAERPVEVSTFDASKVFSLVRRYETVRLTPDPRARPSDPWPMDGLLIWVHQEASGLPKVLSLEPGRTLREQDYRFAADQIAVPELAAILPYPLPIRVGDTYRVSDEGVEALVSVPITRGALQGKFLESKNEIKGNLRTTRRIAVLDISGKLDPETGGTLTLHAKVEFAYTAPAKLAEVAPAAKTDSGSKREGMAREIFGGIVKLSMTQNEVGPPGTPDRPRRTIKRQLLLERQIDAEVPAFKIPDDPPAETRENSWLTYTDPASRFHFRHPQGLAKQSEAPAGTVILASQPQEGDPARVTLFYLEKFTKPPDEIFRQMFEGVRGARGAGLVPGGNETLKWPGLRVLRRQADLKPGERNDLIGLDVGGVTQLDGYVIQFPGGSTLIVEATAPKTQAAAARQQVEDLLQTFKLGPPKPG